MKKNPGWGWKTYLAFFSIVTFQRIFDFLSPDEAIHMYFRVLVAFDPPMALLYYTNLFCYIFNVLSLVPLTLFIYRIQIPPVRLWQWLFIFRCIFDITGHTYEVVYLKTLIILTPIAAYKMIFAILLVLIPSYWACFHYAFGQHRIFSKQINLFEK